MTKLPMTAAGHAALEEELSQRIRVERPRLIQRVQEAIADDTNLAENPEYQAAKADQEINEARIVELEDKLARAEVIDVSKLSGDTIQFGATVTLIDEDTGEKIYDLKWFEKLGHWAGLSKFPVLFPVSREFTNRDGFEIDYVRHQSFHRSAVAGVRRGRQHSARSRATVDRNESESHKVTKGAHFIVASRREREVSPRDLAGFADDVRCTMSSMRPQICRSCRRALDRSPRPAAGNQSFDQRILE